MTDRFTLPGQAHKILSHEGAEIDRVVAAERAGPTDPSSMLASLCRLLSVRQRYMAQVGEHYSVQGLEGILVVDQLDERILKEARQLLHGWIQGAKSTARTRAVSFVVERFAAQSRDLPPYPVAFMVLYLIRRSFDEFENWVEKERSFPRRELEHAFGHYLLGLIDKYVQTRERPTQRHYSEVEKAYSSVTRLQCQCGEAALKVSVEALRTTGDGVVYDELELQCGKCGSKRTVTFDLPYYADLYEEEGGSLP